MKEKSWSGIAGSLVFLACVALSSEAAAQQAIPDTPAGRILGSWLEAHNRGDEESLTTWIRDSYPPDQLNDEHLEKRLAWYLEAAEMFGRLVPQPHSIVEDEPNRLVVQFLSVELKDQDRSRLDPTKVIIITVDVDPEKPRFLERGLGIGPLACEVRR